MAAMANLISRRRFTIERPRRHCLQRSLFRILEVALGIKPPDLAAAFGIAGIPLGDAGARFLAPARFGDFVEMTSQVRCRASAVRRRRRGGRGPRDARVGRARSRRSVQNEIAAIPSGVIARFKA